MKNGCSDNNATQIAERNERAKKIYRYINDVARRSDEATTSCRSVSSLFYTSREFQRQKLRDNCEKLMFLDPVNYGKKALELLWRKVYYDTVSAARKLQQNAEEEYDHYLFTHIVCGIGHFQYLITRIQTDFKLQIKDLDYLSLHQDDLPKDNFAGEPDEELQQWCRSTIHSCLIYLGDLSRYQVEIFHTFDSSIAARYYLQAAHLDLSSGMPYNQLGNLYMEKNHNLDSVCYYIHCLGCSVPFDGALGNLTKLFEKNTQLLSELNTNTSDISQTEHIQSTIYNFLSLIEIWFLAKDESNIAQKCKTIAQDLRLSLDLVKLPLPDINKNYEEYVQAVEDELINPSYINANIMHEIVQICIFTIAKISEIDEKRAFAAKAFSFAILSQLLQKLQQQLETYGFKNPALKYRKRNSVMKETASKEVELNEKIEEEIPIVNGKCKEAEVNIKEEILPKENIENGDIKVNNKKISSKRRRRRCSASSESSDVSDDDNSSNADSSDLDGGNDSDLTLQSDSKSDDSDVDCSDNEAEVDKIKVNGDAIKIETNNNDDSNKLESDADHTESTKVEETSSNNKNEIQNDNNFNEIEIQNFLRGNNFLASIKLLQDFILKEKDLILSCGESGEPLFQCVVDLINIFEYNFKSKYCNDLQETCKILEYAKSIANNLELEYKQIPLPEDVNLRGTNVCKFDTNAAEWNILNKYIPSVYEENIMRILHFIDFGHQIAKIVPRIRYNRTMKIFYLKKIPSPKLTTKLNHKRSREWHNTKKPNGVEAGPEDGALLRRLGRLWLTARVRELESSRRAAPELLALDARALSQHLRRLKHLARARAFILLVPSVVLQELDDLKREQSSARDAIRWLEEQLQSGSRFVRAQRSGQSRSLPLLKYPKKAPPHVHNFIQILEFCYHFVAEEKPQGGNGDNDNNVKTAPMLVMLTGNEPGTFEEQYKEFSLTGAAKAAGISMESVTSFYTRWRQSVHKSGKKR